MTESIRVFNLQKYDFNLPTSDIKLEYKEIESRSN